MAVVGFSRIRLWSGSSGLVRRAKASRVRARKSCSGSCPRSESLNPALPFLLPWHAPALQPALLSTAITSLRKETARASSARALDALWNRMMQSVQKIARITKSSTISQIRLGRPPRGGTPFQIALQPGEVRVKGSGKSESAIENTRSLPRVAVGPQVHPSRERGGPSVRPLRDSAIRTQHFCSVPWQHVDQAVDLLFRVVEM